MPLRGTIRLRLRLRLMFVDFGLLGVVGHRPRKRRDPTNGEAGDVVSNEVRHNITQQTIYFVVLGSKLPCSRLRRSQILFSAL